MLNGHTYHYYAIHKRQTERLWNQLTPFQRMVIAGDAEHKTEAFKRFDAEVKSETEKRYNNPAFPYNEASSFKYPYR